MTLTIASADLEAVVDPDLGGCVRQVRHRASGRRILLETPWQEQSSTTAPLPAGSGVQSWIERYPGGWQVLIPNAGPAARTPDGRAQTWHGEASLNPFQVSSHALTHVRLVRDLDIAPLRIERDITVDAAQLRVTDRVTNVGAEPQTFLWQHHPAFGGDLLETPFVVRVSASTPLTTEGAVAAVATPEGWSPPERGGSLDAFADTGERAWAAVEQQNGPGSLTVVLAWDGGQFPLIWLWCERRTGGNPWFGRIDTVALEPAQSWPVTGLDAVTRATHGGATTLAAAEQSETSVILRVADAPASTDHLLDAIARDGWPRTVRRTQTPSLGARHHG